MNIWITGASSGIGLAVALKYVEDGHTVLATARSADKLEALRDQCKGFEGTVHTAIADVCDMQALIDAHNNFTGMVGAFDKVILNAGTYFPTPAKTFSAADQMELVNINYGGVVNCLDVVLPDMIKRKAGQIAIVASVAGYRGLPKASAYGASKAALINLAESIREELSHEGVDVRLVNPGFIKTPLTDKNKFHMPFLMPVDDAAEKMIKGLSGSKFEITFPAPFAFIMKTLRILPNWAFFRVARKMS